jgi:hypothetical protein
MGIGAHDSDIADSVSRSSDNKVAIRPLVMDHHVGGMASTGQSSIVSSHANSLMSDVPASQLSCDEYSCMNKLGSEQLGQSQSNPCSSQK